MYFGFRNTTIAFGKRIILENVTLDVPRGEIVSLIGRNGCGKSSLLRTVCGGVKPVSGEVIYQDKPLHSWPRRLRAQRIGYLPQVQTAPGEISVRTLVSYGRYPHRKFGQSLRREDEAIIDQALTLLGLTALAEQPLAKLSGGERQRAWIAMAVCQQPEILILDEPTTFLDVSYQLEVLESVRRLNHEMGLTILMVLHDLNLAARYSHRIAAVKDGRIIAAGPPKELLTADLLRDVFGVEAAILPDAAQGSPCFIPLALHRNDM